MHVPLRLTLVVSPSHDVHVLALESVVDVCGGRSTTVSSFASFACNQVMRHAITCGARLTTGPAAGGITVAVSERPDLWAGQVQCSARVSGARSMTPACTPNLFATTK